MQADPGKTARHESERSRSRFCREGREEEERIVQTNAAIANQRALEVGFTAYGEDLERVEVLKYLGRLMAMDTDMQAIRDTLYKTRKLWKMLHRLLRGENMTPRFAACSLRAVAQAVLLYGSETCVLTDSAMRCLDALGVARLKVMNVLSKLLQPRSCDRPLFYMKWFSVLISHPMLSKITISFIHARS
eukprot:scaffold2929_cov138-Skeletonema_marinoi.AAC.1